jgi:hypothetical protein
MRIGLGVDQLGIDADLIARPTDASFKHVADAQLAADLLRIGRLVPIGEMNHNSTAATSPRR